MSLPGTPFPSEMFSEGLTLATTDKVSISPQLTPRSKVKAMLAAVDEDTGSDTSDIQRNNVRKRRDVPMRNHMNIQAEISSQPEHERATMRDSEQDGDGTPIPRGKLASLLNGQNAQERGLSESSSTESDKENAYTRIKNQLMKEQVKSAPLEGEEADLYVPPTFSLNTINPTPPSAHITDIPLRNQDTSPNPIVPGSPVVYPVVQPAASTSRSSSDSDLPVNPQRNSKFLELVARKRAEREAKQALEKEAKKRRTIRQGSIDEPEIEDTTGYSSSEEIEAERRLTQHSRPIRKASKKAIDEMTRETQRLSRNMQLSHQAKTKKKITKESLLARFNFTCSAMGTQSTAANPAPSNTTSSVTASDHEDARRTGTPPTSPLQPEESEQSKVGQPVTKTNTLPDNSTPSTVGMQQEEELPDMTDVLIQPRGEVDKGKREGAAGDEPINVYPSAKPGDFPLTQNPTKVHLPKSSSSCQSRADSDSDLEVVPTHKGKERPKMFSHAPKAKIQDARPLQTLRALAHLNSPPSDKGVKGRPSISHLHMSFSLQKRARQQAGKERKAKIESLKARGIVIQTTEEKEMEQIKIEDLLEKARKENQALREKEKQAARKEKLANGETEALDDSSDDDEEYQEVDNQQCSIDFSGSEEEVEGDVSDEELDDIDENEESDVEGEVDEQRESNALIEEQASDDDRDEDIEADDEDEEADMVMQGHPRRRTRFVMDEEDEIEDEDDKMPKTDSKPVSYSGLAVKVPNLFQGKPNSMPIGMTQAFAATMAETQTQVENNERETQESMLPLNCPPEPALPVLQVEDSLLVVEETQDLQQHPSSSPVAETAPSNRINLHCTQSQLNFEMSDAQMEAAATQMSEIPDPTQDAGFVMSSPGPEQRFVSEPPSSVDTVIVPRVPREDSPKPRKRGRLQRRRPSEQGNDKEDEAFRERVRETVGSDAADAFAVMRNARKQAAEREAFNKKKSEAKTMVEEQAQESEDEYAGLGGASDDESGDEDNDFDKEMIDHEIVDDQERKLAAFYADKERKADEAEIQKIHKDIHNGGFRRRRITEFDLSDSDDDAEARRKRKQREFAKMRKALLENENVGKIAEDPKKMAFFKAIEDRDDGDDLDFLQGSAEDSFRVDVDIQEKGESQSQQQSAPSEPISNKRKRPLEEAPGKTNMRPPATSRRTYAPKKPATLAEIRESVSFLIEEPGSMHQAEPSSSASEDEETTIPSSFGDESHSHPRRTKGNPIIDRLMLKRQSSSASTSSNLAFHAPATSTMNNFLPSLHRAGTSSLGDSQGAIANGITHATTERAAGGGEKGEFVRRGGTKRSSVNFAARESQKDRIVEGVERRRREERERVARERYGGLVSLSRTSTWEE